MSFTWDVSPSAFGQWHNIHTTTYSRSVCCKRRECWWIILMSVIRCAFPIPVYSSRSRNRAPSRYCVVAAARYWSPTIWANRSIPTPHFKTLPQALDGAGTRSVFFVSRPVPTVCLVLVKYPGVSFYGKMDTLGLKVHFGSLKIWDAFLHAWSSQ